MVFGNAADSVKESISSEQKVKPILEAIDKERARRNILQKIEILRFDGLIFVEGKTIKIIKN